MSTCSEMGACSVPATEEPRPVQLCVKPPKFYMTDQFQISVKCYEELSKVQCWTRWGPSGWGQAIPQVTVLLLSWHVTCRDSLLGFFPAVPPPGHPTLSLSVLLFLP